MSLLDFFGLARKSELDVVRMEKIAAVNATKAMSADLTRRNDEISKLTKELSQLQDAYNIVQKQRAEMREERDHPRYLAGVDVDQNAKKVMLYVQNIRGGTKYYMQTLVLNNNNKETLTHRAKGLNGLFGHRNV